MNVETGTQKPHGRLSDLSPFDPQEQGVPPLATLAQPGRQPDSHERDETDGEQAHGCVEWFRYPRRGMRGQHSDKP
jgi:hypothetical protein